jgi:predicted ester cyclase
MAANVFDIARRYVIEVLEEANLDVLRGLVAKDFVRRGPMGEVSGSASLELQIEDERFSDVCIVIDDIIATGEQAVIRYTWYAVHRGELFNIPRTDRRLQMKVVEIIRIEKGRVAEADVHYDVYALFEQLGMLPRPWQLAPPRVTRPVLRLVR